MTPIGLTRFSAAVCRVSHWVGAVSLISVSLARWFEDRTHESMSHLTVGMPWVALYPAALRFAASFLSTNAAV